MKSKVRGFAPRKIQVQVYTRFGTRDVTVRLGIPGDPHVARGGTLELRLVKESSGKVMARRKIRRLLPGFRQEITFSTAGIPSGCCAFAATFVDRYGTPYETEVLQDKQGGNAPWLGSAEGITRAVPAPWTPLEVRRRAGSLEVACWGRRYEFGRTDFFKRVLSKGRSILAGPVRLSAKTNGRKVHLREGTLRLMSEAADEVVLTQTCSSGTLRLKTRTEVTFDGMVRVDWAISSTKRCRLDSLIVDIPIRLNHAKYLYHFPGSWGSAENVGAFPAKNLTMAFRPFIWVGDEERGFCWFTESDANWFKRDANRVTEIRRRGGAAVLRLHLVSDPINLVPTGGRDTEFTGFGQEAALFAKSRAVKRLRYTFGFQATPVKAVTRDAWDRRIICVTHKTPGTRPRLNVSTRLLDDLAQAGVRTVVIFEHWTDAEGHAVTPHRAALKKIVRACRARGLKVLLYFSFLISDHAPEWRDFGKESVVIPKGGYPVMHCLPQPEQSAWRVCLRSAWQDFVVAGVAHAMDEFGVDGVYLDGTEYPFGCCNTEHGCGTLRPDGSIAPTYPIFSARSAMRRLYSVVRSRKPDGQINVHNSTCMTIPTLGWGTSYWDGEQFGRLSRGIDVRQLLPLEAFRAEFMGHQWGVPAEFLCYGQPFTQKEAWAFTLLHDVPVRPPRPGKDLELASALWKVMDEFGRKESEWLPYWRNGEFAHVTPRGAYAGLYRHKQNGVLAVLSNLGTAGTVVKLQLNLARLGLSRKELVARDALNGGKVRINEGRIRCRIPSFGFRVLRIRT